MQTIPGKYFIAQILALATLFFSCTTTHTVRFEVIKPARVDVDAGIKHITLINNTLLPKGDSMGTFYGFQRTIYYDTTRIDTMLSMTALDALAKELTALKRFTLSPDPVIVPLKDTTAIRKPISFDILSLITPPQTDGVIVLESMSTYDQLDYELGFDDRIYARLTLLGVASWRFYDLRQRKIIDRWNLMDTLTYFGEGQTVNQALGDLPGRYESLMEMAGKTGTRYGQQVAPSWEPVTRIYLSDNSEPLESGRRAAARDDWETAAREWKKATSDKSTRRASLAAFNMAVASEVLGNLELARFWLNKSIETNRLPQSAIYDKALKNREENLLLLKKQFGLEPPAVNP